MPHFLQLLALFAVGACCGGFDNACMGATYEIGKTKGPFGLTEERKLVFFGAVVAVVGGGIAASMSVECGFWIWMTSFFFSGCFFGGAASWNDWKPRG